VLACQGGPPPEPARASAVRPARSVCSSVAGSWRASLFGRSTLHLLRLSVDGARVPSQLSAPRCRCLGPVGGLRRTERPDGRVDVDRMNRIGLPPLPSAQGLELFDAAAEHSGSTDLADAGDAAAVRAGPAGAAVLPSGPGSGRLEENRSTGWVTRRLGRATVAGPAGPAARSRADRVLLELVLTNGRHGARHSSTQSLPAERAFQEMGFRLPRRCGAAQSVGAATGLSLR